MTRLGQKMSAPPSLIENMFDDEAVVHAYVPPGWPASVRPLGAEGWERTAFAFLLDCCPPEYRGYPLLLKQPQVLARFGREFVDGQLAATRSNLAGVRTSLGGFCRPIWWRPPSLSCNRRRRG